MIGETILHYKIIEKLGEGGMGVVYKAQNTKLDRLVALKFLPAHALSNSEDKERFIREAKAAASLNHQNIAHIYEIGESNESESGKQMFIAMEYIEGKTLEEVIHSKGGSPLPLKTAINYSIQIADGLQAAHEKGIVHRDIKSANIMVNEKDQIKIMDFGLAKFAGGTKVTKLGTTMGTAAYMSPEQATGEKVDHRTDIWSLGVVMYEMICGQLPFKNDYEQALLYAIMNEEPEPLTAKRTGIPISIDGVISKALAKDPAMRYQHIDEIPADLKTIELKSGSLTTRISSQTRMFQSPQKKSSKIIKQIPWMITGAVIIVSLFLIFFLRTNKSTEQDITKLSVIIPQDNPPYLTDNQIISISPDGKYIAYIGTKNGSSQIFLRSITDFNMISLEETEGADNPFFSPDGKWIAFFSNGKLKKISVNGGTPETLCDAPGDRRGYWADNGKIYFSPNYASGIMEISSDGGNETVVTKLDSSKSERTHRWCQVLPGSKWILYTIGNQTNVNSYDNSLIALQSLVNNKRYILNVSGDMVRYIEPGILIIARNDNLYAAKFNPDDPNNIAPPITILQNVAGNPSSGVSYYDISESGSLIYLPGAGENNFSLALVDMNGKISPLKLDKDNYQNPRFSSDGSKIALTIGKVPETDGNIWMYNLKENTLNRFTFGQGNYDPLWSKDGKYIYYASGMSGSEGILMRPSDGSASAQRIFVTQDLLYPQSITPDSKYLIIGKFSGSTQGDIVELNIHDEQLDTLISTNNNEVNGEVSTDGKWFLYCSNETGNSAVYLKSYPDLKGKWQVSNGSGLDPIWSPKGDKVFYLNPQNKLMSVSITTKPTLIIGNPQVLFDVSDMLLQDALGANYDISPDGKKFIFVLRNDQQKNHNEINVVLNWKKELERKLD